MGKPALQRQERLTTVATSYDAIDFSPIIGSASNEVVTRALVNDVTLPSGKVIALITLDNHDKRPNTLGPLSLDALNSVLDELAQRADDGAIDGIAVTGKTGCFAAGADLELFASTKDTDKIMLMSQFGHFALGKLGGINVPSFAFVNGLALGGGLEVALNCDYRTVSSAAKLIALPEVYLGLIPGWGGSTLLPQLIGIEKAVEVVVSNPLKNNRMLNPKQAHQLGIFDEIIDSSVFLERSLQWADRILTGEVELLREAKNNDKAAWQNTVAQARETLQNRVANAALAPYRALELLCAAVDNDRAAGFAREDEALTELIADDRFKSSFYAFNLLRKRGKNPAGAPSSELAKPIDSVGVIGAGLMASQFALLFASKLRVPVLITDLDQARVDHGIAYIRGEIDSLVSKNRLSRDDANHIKSLLRGTTDAREYASCDWVIEAVFEELSVKQEVFTKFEQIVSDTAVFATNTSSLSVAEIGTALKNPERLLGFHFFNPVAVMPLIEVVKTDSTNEQTLATALHTAKLLSKTAVITADRPGFVVNRLLAKIFSEATRALDSGTDIGVTERALDPLGLPMGPFRLIDLIGWKVAAHIQDIMADAFPDRFYRSETLHNLAEVKDPLVKNEVGKVVAFRDSNAAHVDTTATSTPLTEAELLHRVREELASEISIMLEEGVVHDVADIDLCLLLGAGFPLHAGGITKHLDRTGASESVSGKRFHS
nr:3-hydroxyacyl-CoA dehydrogenase NAD-binding domain-containing protein [Canibacter zhuwentaonis]